MALDFAHELVEFVTPAGGTVLDPFAGSGTTALAARKLACRSILIELKEEYCRMIAERLQQLSLLA
jgi:site-specific DNA-methyltransferase (adenine-specific)